VICNLSDRCLYRDLQFDKPPLQTVLHSGWFFNLCLRGFTASIETRNEERIMSTETEQSNWSGDESLLPSFLLSMAEYGSVLL
jgi:hypothetical protein